MMRARRPLARRRSLALMLRVLLQTLIVLVSVQVSSLETVVSGATLCAGQIAEACDDCPDEDSDDECPPDCPDCHCVHRVIALPGALAEAFREPAHGWLVPHPSPSVASAPQTRATSSLYRPPRTTLAAQVG